jgi:hypothetical protein
MSAVVHHRVLSAVRVEAGVLYPDTFPDPDMPEWSMYRGNAHAEAAKAGVRTCTDFHPDDPAPCVACEVEEGAALMIVPVKAGA